MDWSCRLTPYGFGSCFFQNVAIFCEGVLSSFRWELDSSCRVVNVYMVTWLHFYSKLALLVKFHLVSLAPRDLLIPCSFHELAEPLIENTLVLYGSQVFIRSEVPGWSNILGRVVLGG